jgi:phosphate transport system permease protein
LEAFPILTLVLIGFGMLMLSLNDRHFTHQWDGKLLFLTILIFISACLLSLIPEYVYGLNVSGIIHRSFFSALILIALSIPALGYSLYYFLGATPKARDLSYYPLIIFPVVLMLGAFGILLYRLFAGGITHFSWHMLSTAYNQQIWQTEVWQGDWPQWVNQSIYLTGIRNYVLGTLLLIGLTALISLPIGIGVGIYITEYSTGFLSKLIKFSCTALKSVSVFILGITAVSLVNYSTGTPFASLIRGYFYDVNGQRHLSNGSFVTGAIIISILVIPIIARATEEGILSVPQEMKEGSLALGASQGHTLFNVLVPWSLPNITTGLLLGCAEAAGSLATIWYLSGTGEYGVSPLHQSTSLSYFIFLCRGDTSPGFRSVEGAYQFAAAIILILITVGLSISVLILKKRLAKRYKGV